MALLQDLASRLAIPGLPDWTGLLALLLLLLVGLAYLLMPFSVFGLKGRLDSIEAQLDELQGELRLVSMRLADAPRRSSAAAEDWMDLPPVQPEPVRQPSWPQPARRGRAEPRLD
ncbi:hypothetical protein [Belnapia rosea]|uniref:Uncharacterized protein n=1 Tax=Belnapia rosea TaxID=938405 RepID=A0A1G6JMX7_9PROT|nr:hypothetical protein [Belnapia rosea]SDC20037.1 hypothetical protein SAMN04487779_1001224 [Belnapia rosea]